MWAPIAALLWVRTLLRVNCNSMPCEFAQQPVSEWLQVLGLAEHSEAFQAAGIESLPSLVLALSQWTSSTGKCQT